MRRVATRSLLVLGILTCVLASAAAAPGPAKDDDRGSIVIVFKDGRQQTFRLADIARIEFNAATSSAPMMGSARFLGQWKVGDSTGGTFFITLKPDGVAEKTLGSHGGTWTVVGGEARISWEDGWHDVIRKVGGAYRKVAYEPGKSYSDEPSNTADAEYTEPK
jgi:hypothetical protein